MNKGELIDKIVDKAGLKRPDATAALNAVLEAIAEGLKTGDKITLVGFGTFSVSYRGARKGINPVSQAAIEIADRANVKFKPGKELATSVDGNKDLKASLRKAVEAKAKKTTTKAAPAKPAAAEKKTTTKKK